MFVDPLKFCQKQLLQRFVPQVAESAERPLEFSEMTVATNYRRTAPPATTGVAEVMLPLEQSKRTDPDTELWTALQQIDRDGVNQLPVTRDNQVIGMLTREDVITFLRTLQELRI